MYRRHGVWMGILLGAALLGMSGCGKECDDYCQATVDAIEDLGCLDEWGIAWEDLNFEGAEAYLDHCQTFHQALLDDAREISPEQGDDVLDECADLRDQAAGADDCSVIAVADF